MRNEIRAWTIFIVTATWIGCLIGIGVGIHEATTTNSQGNFLLLFGALFALGAVALSFLLPDKE
jgi:hypothetical protein